MTHYTKLNVTGQTIEFDRLVEYVDLNKASKSMITGLGFKGKRLGMPEKTARFKDKAR